MNNHEEKPERIDPRHAGIPPSSMDPMETIAMEGMLYRGIATRDPHRKWWVRVIGILIALLFLGSALFGFAAVFQNEIGLQTIVYAIFGLIMLVVGVKMIWANL
jgi:hypothetical protein